MSASLRTLLALLAFSAAGCGGRTISTPESLPLTEYPAGRDFDLRVLMTSCSDACVGDARPEIECEAVVDESTKEIELEVCVTLPERTEDGACAETCGPPIVAHCPVSGLSAGDYAVVAESFRQTIRIRPAQ